MKSKRHRRRLLLGIAAVLAAPATSFAQSQGKMRRIGFLWEGNYPGTTYARSFDAFRTGMRELGYTEGKSYVIEHRSAQSDNARLPALAAELVALKVDVIVSSGTPSAVAARDATREIPILITTAADPIGTGLGATLARPGGTITGLTQTVAGLGTKRLDLLRQIVPGMRRVGLLYDPDNASAVVILRHFESDCSKHELKALPAAVRKAEDIQVVFKTLTRDQAQGLVVPAFSTFNAWRGNIIEHAAKHRLPAIYVGSANVEAGGLIAYNTNLRDLYRRAAAYADKIFKGAKPGDLPIEQPTKFELFVNLKTAKALGVTIPHSILLSADKVIE
jgi:ABC-type uncharacterized transport system substrate-binding protein